MAEAQSRTRAAALVWRGGRFLYLLWGGMLLMRHMSVAWPRLPPWVWGRSGAALWLSGPLGRGLLFGAGLAMAMAALKEVWELVDLVLLRVARSREGGR